MLGWELMPNTSVAQQGFVHVRGALRQNVLFPFPRLMTIASTARIYALSGSFIPFWLLSAEIFIRLRGFADSLARRSTE